MHSSRLLLLVGLFSSMSQLNAASIDNGDFTTGDFTGWGLDTDGGPGSGNDFSLAGAPGAYSGRIEADYWAVAGDIGSAPLNDVFFANTLFQEIDTSAAQGSLLRLSFDYVFGGQDGVPSSGEIFTVGLDDGSGDLYGADGNLGFLLDPATGYSSGSVSTVIDSSAFNNVAGWLLTFQLEVGVDATTFDPNGFGSFVEISGVSLEEVSPVGSPGTAYLTLLALGLVRVSRNRGAFFLRRPR